MLNQRRGMCWTSNKIVNTGRKIWRPSKWSGKRCLEIIRKCHYQFFGESKGRKRSWYVGWIFTILQSYGAKYVEKCIS